MTTGNESDGLPNWDEEFSADQPQQTEETGLADANSAKEPVERNRCDKMWGMLRRDGRLLLVTIAIIVAMNIPFIKWILYPFTIFSTWIHEMCHGIAALMVGGSVAKLLVFPDASGLAYTYIPAGKHRRAFVAASGYVGTAAVGCLLLLFRRTKRGPRSGIMVLAVSMVLSVIIWIRNAFGIVIILLMGLALGVGEWKLPSARMRDVYVSVSVTTVLNAITSVQDLFGTSHSVNGEPSSTDAHTVAETLGGPFWFWATLWFLFSICMLVVGLVFAIPGPDEVADFECCGVCLDLGLFNICNKTRTTQNSNEAE